MINKNKNILILSFTLMMLILPNMVYAQPVSGLPIDQMWANFKGSSIALTKLAQYLSYVIGLSLVISGIFKFSQLGSNPQMSPKVPIVMFLTGSGIFALTGTMSIALETMALGSGPGAILDAGSSASIGKFGAAGIQGVLYFVRFLGFVAFIRGWLLLNEAGKGKDGVIGRGLTHIFGGVAAVNMQDTAQIIARSFGWNINI